MNLESKKNISAYSESAKKLTKDQKDWNTNQTINKKDVIAIQNRLIKIVEDLKHKNKGLWTPQFESYTKNIDDLQILLTFYNYSPILTSRALKNVIDDSTIRKLIKKHRGEFYNTWVLGSVSQRKKEAFKRHIDPDITLRQRNENEVETIMDIENVLDKFLRAKLVAAKGDKTKMRKIDKLLDKVSDDAIEIFNTAKHINKHYDQSTIKEAFYKWCVKHKIEYPDNSKPQQEQNK